MGPVEQSAVHNIEAAGDKKPRRTTLVLFAIWVAGLVIICATHIDVILAGLAGFILGCALLLVWWRVGAATGTQGPNHRWRSLAVALLLFAVFLSFMISGFIVVLATRIDETLAGVACFVLGCILLVRAGTGTQDVIRGWRSLAVILLLFLVSGIVIIWATRSDVILAGATCFFVLGCILLVMLGPGTQDASRRWRRLGVVLLLFMVSVSSTRLYYWASWNPTGQTYDDGWGLFLPNAVDQFPPVANGDGYVTVVRRVLPGLIGVITPTPFFVFVHKVGKVENSTNLIFRYAIPGTESDAPPRVRWLGHSRLMIETDRSQTLVITKQLKSIGGISISYKLGSATKQPYFWQRPMFPGLQSQ